MLDLVNGNKPNLVRHKQLCGPSDTWWQTRFSQCQ